jgi:serine/threonine protein kinase
MMTPERWQQVKKVLGNALELDPSQRSAYLAAACAGDPTLRAEVEPLMAAEQCAGTDLLRATHAADGSTFLVDTDPKIGHRIGPYKIVEPIGHGGMGVVYRAFRADDQYQKQVAIKLIRTGQDSAFVVSRFRNERQILASLDHPNIARLLDGGATENGIPYLVMELVEGLSIDAYCDNHKLPTTERLRLFQQVCSAVQYAHQRLIIHRDLKPSNMLVTAEGVPKLLDFGIAKVLDPGVLGGSVEKTVTLFRVLTPDTPARSKSEANPSLPPAMCIPWA